MNYENYNNKELELLDTTSKLSINQIKKVLSNIYNFGKLDLETQQLILAFKKLLNTNKGQQYANVFNKYKVIGKKYVYDDDYESVLETLFYVGFKKDMPTNVKSKIITNATKIESELQF